MSPSVMDAPCAQPAMATDCVDGDGLMQFVLSAETSQATMAMNATARTQPWFRGYRQLNSVGNGSSMAES